MKLNGYDARFIHLAEEINQSMPSRVVQMTADALNNRQRSLKGAKVLALGVAYKPNVGDVRESPALEVIHLLQQRGAEVTYADPHVPTVGYNGSQLTAVIADEAAVKGADCVVILTDHKEFDYKKIAGDASLVVDTRNATWGILNPKAEVIRL
jgi:UDP-N-acetyl-D-glucosamine dehydrogenase